MRAIAEANEASAQAMIKEERDVADNLEKIEKQNAINESINKRVRQEEYDVTEAANKRMSELNAKRATEADKAAIEIQKA